MLNYLLLALPLFSIFWLMLSLFGQNKNTHLSCLALELVMFNMSNSEASSTLKLDDLFIVYTVI